MLLKRSTLEAIRDGAVEVVFRRWKRPTVKTGGSLQTAIGVLAIDRVAEVDSSEISEGDARRAGFASRAELSDALAGREGSLYRIDLHHAGADPRLALRQDDDLSAADLDAIREKLDRFDARSPVGPWTRLALEAIGQNPRVVARRLAEQAGHQRDRFKRNVRKLKSLGLTVSHDVGYELSPRGRAVLDHLQARDG